jgi:hypothetical protein
MRCRTSEVMRGDFHRHDPTTFNCEESIFDNWLKFRFSSEYYKISMAAILNLHDTYVSHLGARVQINDQ